MLNTKWCRPITPAAANVELVIVLLLVLICLSCEYKSELCFLAYIYLYLRIPMVTRSPRKYLFLLFGSSSILIY